MGELWKIIPAENSPSRPIASWKSGPGEIRITFDKPIDPAILNAMRSCIQVTQGRYVQAGDRFETMPRW